MTAEEKIKRITELLNALAIEDMCREVFDEEFMKQSINDIKEEMWILYCFASDVCNTLNM